MENESLPYEEGYPWGESFQWFSRTPHKLKNEWDACCFPNSTSPENNNNNNEHTHIKSHTPSE